MEEKARCAGVGLANPWPKPVSFITTGSALPASALALRALLKENRRKLPIYGGLWAALATVARRDICARCPYYGEYCSTLFGKVTPLMFPRSDKPLTTQGFYWDLALLPAIFLYPVPEVFRVSKRLFAAYLAAWALYLTTMYNLACKRCPLEACPVNRWS
jgi:hypothetical protein